MNTEERKAVADDLAKHRPVESAMRIQYDKTMKSSGIRAALVSAGSAAKSAKIKIQSFQRATDLGITTAAKNAVQNVAKKFTKGDGGRGL